ncbi:MAG: hypothetical protein LBE12_09725 [Planctomycetaceae bacterium]|nr:hypothetical protein [Planctomycetaceae bacterium]
MSQAIYKYSRLKSLSTLNYYRLWKMGEFLLRHLHFVSPPVMQFTPPSGVKIKKQKFHG